MTASVAGVILAGGLSRRMGGGDKSLKILGDRPMLTHVIERLAAQVEAIAINANGDPGRLVLFGLPVIADPITRAHVPSGCAISTSRSTPQAPST